MKIYIAGKITDLPVAEAEQNFALAESTLELAGHTALNPLKLVDQDPERAYEECLLDALACMLVMAEGVYFLSNWRDSMGARIEHAIAVEFKMPIFYAASELPVGSDWPEQSDDAEENPFHLTGDELARTEAARKIY